MTWEYRCAGLGVIDKCSPQGIWFRFCVPHSFFIVVYVTKVNTEHNGQIVYCEEETIKILGVEINHRILWSGYKVRPTEPLCPSYDHVVKEEGIGGPPIQIQSKKGDNDFFSFDINTSDSEDKLGNQSIGAQEDVDKGDIESPNAYPD